MIHVVTLQRNPAREMPELVQAIEQASEAYRRPMLNVWLVDTRLDARELATVLRRHVQRADWLMVLRVRVSDENDFGGLLKKASWEWIRARLGSDFDGSNKDER